MAIGIVSDKEFEEELAKAIHKPIEKGRGNTKEVPEVIREIIAEDAIASDLTGEELAKKHNVSESSVSAYKNGATSTTSYNEPNARLKKKTDEVRTAIIGTARARLIEALAHITPEKMADAKLRDVASVAKDMSAIVSNMEPQVSTNSLNAQFIFHVPKQRQESDYDVIDVTQ